MEIHTTEIAKELLAKNILSDSSFTLKEIFEIRDALMILARYGLEDKNLLNETLKFISQKAEE